MSIEKIQELKQQAVITLGDNDQSFSKFKDFCMTAFTGLSLKDLINLAGNCEKIEKSMVHKVSNFVDDLDSSTLEKIKDMDNIFTMCTLMGAQQMFGTAMESILERCKEREKLNEAAWKTLDELKNESAQDSGKE